MSWYSFFKLSLVRPFVKVAYKARVEGEENIPATGGAIIACNHTSATETYVLPALIKRQVTYPAKAELFNLRFQKAQGELTNTSRFRAAKKEIARILTALRSSQDAA